MKSLFPSGLDYKCEAHCLDEFKVRLHEDAGGLCWTSPEQMEGLLQTVFSFPIFHQTFSYPYLYAKF